VARGGEVVAKVCGRGTAGGEAVAEVWGREVGGEEGVGWLAVEKE